MRRGFIFCRPDRNQKAFDERPDRARGPCLHPVLSRHARRLARRLPDARCVPGGALCGQGAEPEGAGVELRPALGAQPADRADDPRDRLDDVPDDQDRNRGAASGAEPHQAAEAALQRAAQGRQVVPEHPGDRRPSLSDDPQAPGRAQRQGGLLRSLRQRRGGEPDADAAAEGLPAAKLHRQPVRGKVAALPALPDQALLGALRGAYLGSRVPGERARRGTVPAGQDDEGAGPARPRDGDGGGGDGIRARRGAARPHPGSDACAGEPGDQSRGRVRGGRDRAPYRGRTGLRAGLLHPREPELGQPGLLPEDRLGGGAGGDPRRVHRPVLREQGAAAAASAVRRHRGAGTAGAGSGAEGRAPGADPGAAAGGEEGPGRRGAQECAGEPGAEDERDGDAGAAARRALGGAGARPAAGADRGL